MIGIFRPSLRLFAACLFLYSSHSAVAQENTLSLEDCIDRALQRNLQHLNEYQNLIGNAAQLARTRAPFGLQMEADFSLPSYNETRDVQESVALQNRIMEESTTFTYNGRLTLSQRIPYIGRFSVVTNAQRRDFSSTFRSDYLDMVGDMRVNYTHELLHTPREEISLKQAELSFTNAQFTYSGQKLLLEGRVIDAYYNLVQSIRRLEIEEQRLDQSNASLELAQRKFEIGLMAEVDALGLRVAMLRAEASYAQAETQIERRRDTLRQLLDMEINAPLEVVTEVKYQQYDIDSKRAFEVGLKHRTDMQQADIVEEIRRLSLNDTKRRNGITATLNANVSLLGRGDEIGDISRNLARNQWGVGIQVNLPLLDNGQRRGEIRQAQIQLEQSRLSSDITHQGIIQDIRNAIRNLREAERLISLRQSALEFAERTYEVEQSRFELGLTQSRDLLIAQADLTQASIEALDAIIDYQRQLKNLRLATMADLDQLVSAE